MKTKLSNKSLILHNICKTISYHLLYECLPTEDKINFTSELYLEEECFGQNLKLKNI